MPIETELSGMVLPASKETYFNTKWVPKQAPLGAYDMLYHPPDYDPKSARSDRTDPGIIKDNIWQQEFKKRISSTNHFMYGRPSWPILDRVNKQYARVAVKNENPQMRIYTVLQWAKLLSDAKPNLCVDS